MKELHVTVRVRNNLLLERRRRLGVSQADIARAMGVTTELYGQLEGLRAPPFTKTRTQRLALCVMPNCSNDAGSPRHRAMCPEHRQGARGAPTDAEASRLYREARDLLSTSRWSDAALKVAAYHGVPPEELWPEAILEVSEPLIAGEIDVRRLAELTGADRVAQPMLTSEGQDNLATSVTEVLQTLRPREREVLQKRFGLDGEDPMTCEEVAEGMGIGRQSVWQIEQKALRLLRHPSRANKLR